MSQNPIGEDMKILSQNRVRLPLISRLNEAFLEKRVNSNMIGMRAKEKVLFAYTPVTYIHRSELFRLIKLEIT